MEEARASGFLELSKAPSNLGGFPTSAVRNVGESLTGLIWDLYYVTPPVEIGDRHTRKQTVGIVAVLRDTYRSLVEEVHRKILLRERVDLENFGPSFIEGCNDNRLSSRSKR